MMKEMYCVKVSFRGYTDECERIMTNMFIRMGLTVNLCSDTPTPIPPCVI